MKESLTMREWRRMAQTSLIFGAAEMRKIIFPAPIVPGMLGTGRNIEEMTSDPSDTGSGSNPAAKMTKSEAAAVISASAAEVANQAKQAPQRRSSTGCRRSVS